MQKCLPFFCCSIRPSSLEALIRDDAGPLVLLLPVHDVAQPRLDNVSVLARLAGRKRDVNVLAPEVDHADGRDEESSARREGLDEAARGGGVGELGHGELALDDLERLEGLLGGVGARPAGGEASADELEHRAPGDAVEDDAVVQRRRDELQLARFRHAPHDEEVGRARLGDETLLPEQPEDLVEAAGPRLALRDQRWAVVGACTSG